MVSFKKIGVYLYMQTPFTFGRTVRDRSFTNREKETQKLISNFENRVNTILISPRRWGKSSLVEKAASKVEGKKIRIIMLDLFPIRNEEEFYLLFSKAVIKATSNKVEEWLATGKKFMKQISPKFSVSSESGQDFDISFDWATVKANYKELLQLPEKIAKEKNIQLVICMDEFQNIGSFDEPELFQKRLRSEWQHQQNTTYCLYGSKQHMMMELFEKQSNPFYKFGEIMYLQKIEEKNWVKYITESFDRTNKFISPELALDLARTVKCHPYYVQQLSHLTWINTVKKANAEMLKESTEELLDQNAILYHKDTEDLSSTQLNFLKALASGESALSSKDIIDRYNLGTSANVNKIKETLLKREIIDIQMGKAEFVDPAFELWFKKNILKMNLFRS